MHCIDPSGKEYVYRNKTTDKDNVDDLVTKFIKDVGVGLGMQVHLEN